MDKLVAILIQALCAVESGGDPTAVGDDGQAVGILQIHPAYVQEANRCAGKNYFTLDSRTDVRLSKAMVRIVMKHQIKKYRKTHGGDDPSVELLARWHNGGVRGVSRNPSATDHYWSKVSKHLTTQRKPPCRNPNTSK